MPLLTLLTLLGLLGAVLLTLAGYPSHVRIEGGEDPLAAASGFRVAAELVATRPAPLERAELADPVEDVIEEIDVEEVIEEADVVESEGAVLETQLGWLPDHQDEDGRWDADGFMKHDTVGVPCTGPGRASADLACTSAAILAMHADGSTLRSGAQSSCIKKAVRWLRKQQLSNGAFHGKDAWLGTIDHAIATYALCETQGLGKYKIVRKNAVAALEHLIRLDVTNGSRHGGLPRRDQLRLLAWSFWAFRSAQDFALPVPKGFERKTLKALLRIRSADRALGRSIELACRLALGEAPESAAMRRAVAGIEGYIEAAVLDFESWFFATHALYQLGGSAWAAWSLQTRQRIVAAQIVGAGCDAGSWDPVGPYGSEGGRVYATALAGALLTVYYRYSRLVRNG